MDYCCYNTSNWLWNACFSLCHFRVSISFFIFISFSTIRQRLGAFLWCLSHVTFTPHEFLLPALNMVSALSSHTPHLRLLFICLPLSVASPPNTLLAVRENFDVRTHLNQIVLLLRVDIVCICSVYAHLRSERKNLTLAFGCRIALHPWMFHTLRHVA